MDNFKKHTQTIAKGLLLALIMIALCSVPVFAIGNPDDITFGSQAEKNMYLVFQNLTEDDDWLFLAESYIHYAVPPTDYTAAQAFSFQIIDTDGTTVLFSTPILEYENYPTSIYLTAAQATAAGLTWEDPYSVRLTGNATIFGAPSEGVYTRTHALQTSDYITDSPVGLSLTILRLFSISIMEDIEDEVTPTDPYVITVQGIDYLTTDGGTIFLRAVTGANVWMTDLIQSSSSPIILDPLDPTETLASSLTPRNQLGQVIGDGITNLGVWIGTGTTIASIIVLFLIVLIVGGYGYIKFHTFYISEALAIILLALGGYLGLIPLAVVFAIIAFIVFLTGYYFFTRGSL